MKYLLLINADPEDRGADDAEAQQRLQHWFRYTEDLGKAGVMLAGEALKPPTEAKVARLPIGSVTDGPFAEGKEVLGGFYLIDVPDMETAIGWAQRMPPHVSVEVRECEVFG